MNTPLNYFLHAAGPAAQPTLVLDWVFTAIALLVCIIVGLLLILAILRKRPAEAEKHLYRDAGNIQFVYAGTGLSICVLFAMMIYALVALNRVANPPSAPSLTLTVTGYDWWWNVEYEGASSIITANEIHIPTHVPVLIKLKSADVIHAFWVPELAGKTEMIPGLTNQQWIEADKPGIYHGKCTQFCGLQHAHMDFEVVAESPADFERWQQQQASVITAKKENKFFNEHCGGCHTVRGTTAAGKYGPDLTHLGSRRMIAAGTLSNTTKHVMEWVEHPQEIKPGALMPDTDLSRDEAKALSEYLSTLK